MKLSEEYLAKFNDKNLRDRLLDENNIDLLERLLESEGQKLERLQRLQTTGRLDFGPIYRAADVIDEFPDIKERVDSFLEVEGIDTPTIKNFGLLDLDTGGHIVLAAYGVSVSSTIVFLNSGYLNGLLPSMTTFVAGIGLHIALASGDIYRKTGTISQTPLILLKKARRADRIIAAGHEYVHHVLHEKGIPSRKNVLHEGIARAIERYLAADYADREANEAFLYYPANHDVSELKSAYIWMCKELGITPKRDLLKVKTLGDYLKFLEWIIWKLPLIYGYNAGTALFSLYETKIGSRIYADLLREQFELPKQFSQKIITLS